MECTVPIYALLGSFIVQGWCPCSVQGQNLSHYCRAQPCSLLQTFTTLNLATPICFLAEFGDYDPGEHGQTYLEDFKFCPEQVSSVLKDDYLYPWLQSLSCIQLP